MRAIRNSLVALSLVAMPMASVSAQAINPGDGEPTCILSPNVFTNITPTACVGFYNGNTNSGTGIVSGNEYYEALNLLGQYTGQTNAVLKIDSWGGGSLGTTVYGWTVIGFHWGNYPNGYEDGESVGNVSAYYLFNAGAGVNSITLNSTQGISNAIILSTGEPDFNTVVPEPSTYLLMAAGLAGLGVVARRRRA